jgi:hypothetical protein
MQILTRRFLICIASILLLAFAGSWLHAQTAVQRLSEPKVISGPDVGFRIERYQGGKPVGTLVVRVNGEWREAQFVVRPQIATP